MPCKLLACNNHADLPAAEKSLPICHRLVVEVMVLPEAATVCCVSALLLVHRSKKKSLSKRLSWLRPR
jgi:hypothetical protein